MPAYWGHLINLIVPNLLQPGSVLPLLMLEDFLWLAESADPPHPPHAVSLTNGRLDRGYSPGETNMNGGRGQDCISRLDFKKMKLVKLLSDPSGADLTVAFLLLLLLLLLLHPVSRSSIKSHISAI